jgi:hypothetical protein
MFDQSQWNVRRVAIFILSMFEVVIIERGPARWEWQVCDSDGVQIMHGREKTRAEASRPLQLICKDGDFVIRFGRNASDGDEHGCEGDFGKEICRAVERG